MPEPRRLSDFSPSWEQTIYREELERRAEIPIRSEKRGGTVLKEQPRKKPIPTWKQDIYKEEIERRRVTALPATKERGALGELAAGFGRGVLGVVAAPAEIADVAGEALGWEALEKAGEAGVKAVEKYIEESPKLKRTESISKNILKNPELWKDPRWYSSIVGEGLPTILSMVVPGMAAAKAAKVAKLGAKGVRAARIAGGLSAGVGLEAAGAASDIRHHEEQTGEEIPISTKLQSVLGTGIVAGSLEYVPIFAIFGKTGAKKLVGSVLSGMALEGTTEGAQGLIANAFAKAGYDADRNMVDGVVESIVGGVLLGGGMGAVSRVTNFKERVDETNPDEVSDILEQVEGETEVTPKKAIELTEAEKRQVAIDREFEARRTPEERQAEIEAAMPATPMTTISEETTKLAEEGIRPAPVEEVVEPPIMPLVVPAPMKALGMRPPKPAVPFMITKETESGLKDLGYTKEDIGRMTPEDALGIVEGKIAKEPIAKEVVKIEPSEILKPDIESKYGRFLEKVGKRLHSEAIGQDILDTLEEGNVLPESVSRTFWEDTFFKLPEDAQNNIKKYLTSLTGMKPGDVMATLKGKDIKAKDWMDIAGVVENDLSTIEHLEGTERGYIALMAYANEQIKTKPKEPTVEKVEKIIEPEVEIPVLTDTTQAIAFGEKATPEQITELKRLRKESEARYDVLVKEDKLDEAGEEAFKVQLYREAFEAKEKPIVPKVEKPEVVEKELSTEIEKRGIKGNDLLDALDRIEEAKSYDKTIEIDKTGHVTLYHRTDKASAESITKSGYMTTKEPGLFFGSKPEGQISGYGDTVIKVQIPIEKLELNDVFTDEVHFRLPEAMPKGKYKVEVIKKPAKPITPKPPKPTPPEAARKEIEAKPIPKVAPEVEKKEEPGFAWIKGKQKPILSARKITKGKNKGKYEIILTKGRDEEGNVIPGAKKIVTEKHIITMPIEKGFIEARPLKKEEEPLFLKRKTATAIGVSKAPALQSEMDKITLPWKNAPIVEVVQAQPELPDVILKASKGEIVDGVYYKGTVYIVADNMTSPEAAVKTLLHESFGHYGMRELLGKDFGDIMNKVYIAKRAEVVKIADEYGYDIKAVKDRALAADEWLAREAASNPESSWVQKVIATIRQFMRRIMPSLKLSNAEIQQLMEDAKTYVERGRPRARITEALFEEPGYQVRAYHGGPSMFERFRTAKIGEGEGYQAIAWGLYFTDVKDIAKGYAERLALRGKTPKERYLYQVTLHKGKEPSEYDWLTWDKFITPETKDKILKQLKKEFPDDAKFMVSWDMSYGEGKRGLTGQNLYRQLIEEIANTKNRKAGFEKFRPSDKEASLFLLRAGIDGVKYPAGTITGIKTKGFNYVVFDEEAISIDERIAFAKRKPTAAEKAAEAFRVLGIKPKLKPEEPLPKRARSVGLAYQDISEEAKRLEVEMGLEYPKVTRTHAELREQADRIMGDQEQLIKTMEKEKNFTEAEGLVVRRAAATGLESLMKVVATKDVKKANEMHKTFKAGIGNKLQDLHSEYGRNLESLKEVVSPESIAKAFAGLERDLNKDDMDKFNSAAEALGQGDAKPMINFQKHLKATKQDPKLMDYVYEYWYNSILSGVPTHVVNVASNTAWGAWQVGVHKPLLAAIDPLVAKFQKRPTEYYMAEIIPALAGIKRGFKPGVKGAKEMLVKGYTTDADLDKFAADMGKSVGAFSRSPNKYLKAIAPFLTMPTRALRGMDIWAKQMNYEAELGSIAKRMEKKGEGKYEELLKNPNANMMKEASQYADYTTFMGKLGKVGTMIEKLRTAVPGGRFIMPFVRTIANLVQRGVEMTPGVGAMKLLGGKVKGKEVTQVLVKQIEGAMIALVVASMFDDDEITGDVPANKAEREAFYRQGKKPWSIKVGDTWYQYRRIEPFNTPIAAVGILYDTWKRTGEEPSTEFVYRSAAGFVNNIIDSSYLSGLTQVLDSVRKADKWPQKLTNMFDRTIASFSPMSSFQRSFVRAIEAVDKEGAILRKPKGAIETLAAATPFISEMVPARKDVWGEEVVIEGSPLAQWLPWKTARATRDVVEKEIERLHGLGLISYPGMPAKYMSVAGKRLDLDDEQYDKLITESGQASKKKLDSLVGTSYWKMLSDKEKASRVQRIIKSDRKKTRNVIKRGLGVGAVPGMVPWKTTKKRKRPAWQEPALGKKPGWQKSIGF